MRHSLYILLFLLSTWSAQALTASDLYGKWKVVYGNGPANQWTLVRPHEDSLAYTWGKYFEFREDGTYTEYASAPCGLDDNHYMYSGHWLFNPQTGMLLLNSIKVVNDRPGIYQNYKVLSEGSMKIHSLTHETLQVELIQYWEKISKKTD